MDAGVRPVLHTWLVECYGPEIDAGSVAAASDRARAAVEVVRERGADIEYLGALLIAGDDAVFHAFAAGHSLAVADASFRAGLAYTRIVEAISLSSPTLSDALTRLLAAASPSTQRGAA
jgi:hypothetical protein